MSRNIPRRGLLLAAATSVLVPAAAHAAAPLTPSADLYVSARAPRHNYGASKHLVVQRAPARQAFIRLQPAGGLPAGSRAVLRVYPLSSSKRGLVLRHASDRPWNERAISLGSAPKTGPRVVRSGALRARHWKAIDVTHLLGTRAVAALARGTGAREKIVLATREWAGHAPRLELGGAAAANGA